MAESGEKAKRGAATRVRVGHVSLSLYPHAKGWRFAWKCPVTDKWKYGTRKDRKKALAAATAKATELAGSHADLALAIQNPETASIIRRALELQITHTDLDRITLDKTIPVVSIRDATSAFLAAKEDARGKSHRNVKALKSYTNRLCNHFGDDTPLTQIRASDLEDWFKSPTRNGKQPSDRTRKNRRAAAITIWKWSQDRRYLPDGPTEAQRTSKPIVTTKVPETWTPAELSKLIDACPESHLPWLLIGSLAGLRSDEMYPDNTDSEKDTIRWKDIWLDDRNLIEIRPEVAKSSATGISRRRLVPICPALQAWLKELRPAKAKDTDLVCRYKPPYREQTGMARSITAIIGDAVGGWRSNALRHSFISYRASLVGLAQTAMEAGNSESEARKSYHDAMPKEQAEAWFNHFPS